MVLFISILRITMIKSSIKTQIFIDKGNTINKVSDGISKNNRVKFKNMVIFKFLTKFKLLIKTSPKSGFLTFEARLAFVKLKKVFIKALILYYFDLKYYIYIETNLLDYDISRIFNQLTLNDLSRQYLVIFYYKKIIQTET